MPVKLENLSKLEWNAQHQLGVSKNRENTPNWMVKITENPIKMDDLGPTPIFKNTQLSG